MKTDYTKVERKPEPMGEVRAYLDALDNEKEYSASLEKSLKELQDYVSGMERQAWLEQTNDERVKRAEDALAMLHSRHQRIKDILDGGEA